MTTAVRIPQITTSPIEKHHRPIVFIFSCHNAKYDTSLLNNRDIEIKQMNVPCSSLVKELFLLQAFEAGSCAIIVLVCPEGHFMHLEGNVRARKRVERVKKLLNEIGLDENRLNIYNITPGDNASVDRIFKQTVSSLAVIGTKSAVW